MDRCRGGRSSTWLDATISAAPSSMRASLSASLAETVLYPVKERRSRMRSAILARADAATPAGVPLRTGHLCVARPWLDIARLLGVEVDRVRADVAGDEVRDPHTVIGRRLGSVNEWHLRRWSRCQTGGRGHARHQREESGPELHGILRLTGQSPVASVAPHIVDELRQGLPPRRNFTAPSFDRSSRTRGGSALDQYPSLRWC